MKTSRNETLIIAVVGLVIGVIAVALTVFGNPANMGFCIACFIRDTAGGLGLHQAAAVQYIRPEIIGLVLGAFLMAVFRKEFSPRGGSAPLTRFVIGFFVMIGCLVFLGCPFRMVLRIGGGDLNALVGLVGFAVGIGIGILFLNHGYSLKRTYRQPVAEGVVLPVIEVAMLILLIAAPSFIYFTEAGGGPGALHAPILISLAAGLIVGALAQVTRLCMVGGIRDFLLFRQTRLLVGFLMIIVAALVCNLLVGSFNLGFVDQPIAHSDGLWNFLGMLLVGYGCALLGGCPLRQLVLAGEGNVDSAVTFIGLLVGAACAHNFGLASSTAGATANGKLAVVIGLVVVTVIAAANTFHKE
ncbi:MAG: YedE-related selenium metabolism membrane protein [Lachnospiraceae bacterium]|nr:YedE-related selenium metabolism membrane protein [Lachnospiraceae bacterium]